MSFVAAAGAPLLGVIVGGALTFVGQARLDRRREQREFRREKTVQEREVASQARQTRMAARLVFSDLWRIAGQLRASRETHRWWTALLLADGAWRQHGDCLSRELGDDDWLKVAAIFTLVAEWNNITLAARRYYWIQPHLKLRGKGLTGLRDELLAAAPVAMEALQNLATDGDAAGYEGLVTWARGEADVKDRENSPVVIAGFPQAGGGG
jgi:hypothetical protein